MNLEEFEKLNLKNDFLSPLEFGNRIGYTRNTVTTWCKSGKIKFIRFGKKIYIYKTELVTLLEKDNIKNIDKQKHKNKKVKK
jgi:excisionase family DNA binding protein